MFHKSPFSFTAEATVGFQPLQYTQSESVGSFQACVEIIATTNDAPIGADVLTVVSTASNTARGATNRVVLCTMCTLTF